MRSSLGWKTTAHLKKPPDKVATLGALAKLPHLARTTATTPGEPIPLSLSPGVSLDVRFIDDTVNHGQPPGPEPQGWASTAAAVRLRRTGLTSPNVSVSEPELSDPDMAQGLHL